ncbi:hypothetical protein [Nocardia sp. CA-120079]|uniref:hypothetical protein n=1 Tax=Nocardia sp. CA-120079 TaxID=3239974 RepID=UPI003D986C4C
MPIRTTVPDLLGMRLAHRAMLADTARLPSLTADIAVGHTACPPTRAAAVTEYLLLLCDSIHHHHDIEDTVLVASGKLLLTHSAVPNDVLSGPVAATAVGRPECAFQSGRIMNFTK